mmetsp:Transcript_3985/g.5592  ORF Transcript_3985/g.5592 Transcript_3985/m.5592 type:complete len:275 (-) Transcript_3985:64-888(-)
MARLEEFQASSSVKSKANYLGDDFVTIVAHGGGGTVFGQSNPLVRFCLENVTHTVYSAELPFHGKNNTLKTDDYSCATALEQFIKVLEPIFSNGKRKILFFGYSTGGIFLMHAWLHFAEKELLDTENSIAMFIGTSFQTPNTASMIDTYWQADSFVARNKSAQMQEQHGPLWRQTAEAVRAWFKEESDMWLPEESRTSLLSKPNVFFIQGELDQPFPVADLIAVMEPGFIAQNVLIIPCDHFTYFGKRWPIVEKTIDFLIHRYKYSKSQPLSKL